MRKRMTNSRKCHSASKVWVLWENGKSDCSEWERHNWPSDAVCVWSVSFLWWFICRVSNRLKLWNETEWELCFVWIWWYTVTHEGPWGFLGRQMSRWIIFKGSWVGMSVCEASGLPEDMISLLLFCHQGSQRNFCKKAWRQSCVGVC